MKKVIKIFLIVSLVICILIACLAIWQRKNISMIYTAVTSETEEITKMQEENNKVLVDEVSGYLEGELREPTKEEKDLVEKGEMQITDVYNTIIKEHIEKKNNDVISNIQPDKFDEEKNSPEKSDKEKNSPEKSDKEKNKTETETETAGKTELTQEDIKKKTDELVSNALSELYDLQGAYTARSEALIAQAESEFNSIRKNGMKWAQARTHIITKYTPKVSGIQASCDGDVEAIITRLEGELKEIGANLGIVKTMRETYEKEKELKLAYYAGTYLD
ncbi:MAG: hypothetical protein IKA17_09140 [Clostridia bacterium]|nr:hypothetical protein [Clostridia bacterium]